MLILSPAEVTSNLRYKPTAGFEMLARQLTIRKYQTLTNGMVFFLFGMLVIYESTVKLLVNFFSQCNLERPSAPTQQLFLSVSQSDMPEKLHHRPFLFRSFFNRCGRKNFRSFRE